MAPTGSRVLNRDGTDGREWAVFNDKNRCLTFFFFFFFLGLLSFFLLISRCVIFLDEWPVSRGCSFISFLSVCCSLLFFSLFLSHFYSSLHRHSNKTTQYLLAHSNETTSFSLRSHIHTLTTAATFSKLILKMQSIGHDFRRGLSNLNPLG